MIPTRARQSGRRAGPQWCTRSRADTEQHKRQRRVEDRRARHSRDVCGDLGCARFHPRKVGLISRQSSPSHGPCRHSRGMVRRGDCRLFVRRRSSTLAERSDRSSSEIPSENRIDRPRACARAPGRTPRHRWWETVGITRRELRSQPATDCSDDRQDLFRRERVGVTGRSQTRFARREQT